MFVLYHKQCLDGTASAAAIFKKYPQVKGIPLSHSYTQEDIKELLNQREQTIYILDFMLKKEDLQSLLENKNQIIHIDHHASCIEDIKYFKKYQNFVSVFDLNHSASYLSWEYIHNYVPKLILYIEDRDLWKKQYPETDIICYYLFSKVLDKPEELLNYIQISVEEIYKKGLIIQEYIQSNFEQILKKSEPLWIRFGNFLKKYKVPAINSTVYISELGNELAKKYNGISCIFYITDSMVQLSFRSIENNYLTAKEAAEYFGGGGHKHAAGARIRLKKFLKIIKK